MTHRAILPNRRPSTTAETEWAGHRITVTIGLHPTTGEPMEIFADLENGGDIASVCRDAAVALSLALQHGASPAALDKTMTRVPAWVNGAEAQAPASPIGTIIAEIRRAV